MARSLVLSQKKEFHLQKFLPLQRPTSGRHRPGLSPSERTGPGSSAFKALADRPAQKNATSDKAGHMIHRPDHEADHVIHRPVKSEVHS